MGNATVGSRMSPKPHVGKTWFADSGTIGRIFKKWGLEGSFRLLGTWPQRGLWESGLFLFPRHPGHEVASFTLPCASLAPYTPCPVSS